MTNRFFVFIPSTILACIPMEPCKYIKKIGHEFSVDGQNGVTFPTPPAIECQEITKGTTDVVLSPPGSQLDQTTVTASCPAGTRLRIDNQFQAAGATGTITCSAGGWLDGTTVVTMVSCDPECQEITKGTTDVILSPPGSQLISTAVSASCPAGKRLKIDNQLQTGATGTITCSAGGWLDGTTAVTMVSCVPECQEITKGTTDVILTPSGTQVDQTTVTVSCPAGTRVKIDNQVLLPGATGTLTCSAGGWLDGTTTVTMVSCDPVCNQTPTEVSGYFYSISTGSNWMNAEQDCYSKGGHLFSVQSQADNDFLLCQFELLIYDNSEIALTSICSPGSLWIGGHRYLSNPPFAWTDNSPFVYTNWATGRPDTGASTTHCILFNSPSGEWTDADCYSLSSFVCRYSSLTPTIQMSPATCPAGWSAMTLCGTSACYLVSTVPAEWAAAEAACQAFGINAHLASTHCLAELNYIKGIVTLPFIGDRGWLGAFRTGDLMMFSWTDGTPIFDLTRGGTFNGNDDRCSRSYYYVCKTVL